MPAEGYRLVYIGDVITPRLAVWPPGYRDPDAVIIREYAITEEMAQLPLAELEAMYPLVRGHDAGT